MSTIDPMADSEAPRFFYLDEDAPRQPSYDELIDAARAAIAERFHPGILLNSPRLVKDYLRLYFAKADREVFILILLNTQHQLIRVEEITQGTIDSAAIYPREVIKSVIQRGASGVLFAHNHPSGIAEPSNADRRLTDRLRAVLGTIDVHVIDHLVVAGNNITSFAEKGWV